MHCSTDFPVYLGQSVTEVEVGRVLEGANVVFCSLVGGARGAG